MKIESAQIVMQGEHQYVEKSEEKETLRAWVGDQRPDFEGRERATATPAQPADNSAAGRPATPAPPPQARYFR